jgi:hypothetical protein
VQHRDSMKSFQALRSPALPLTSFHDFPVPLISFSIVLRHILLGLPLLLYPWGFQSNAVFSIAPTSLRNVCPVQFHFLLFLWFSIGFCWVILHNSSFVFFNCCLSVYVDNYTIIVPTKCTSFLLLKAQNFTICTFCLCILSPYMFQPAWVIFRGRNASA